MAVMKRIGARAHDYGNLPAEELAAKLASHGFCCAQLALNIAIQGLALKPGQLNPGLAWQIGQAFQRSGVQIAILGCYINPISTDQTIRRNNLEFFKDHLRYVRDMGGSMVGLETGTPTPDYVACPNTRNEETYQFLVRSMAELVEEAEKHGAKVAVESVAHHSIYNPTMMKRLVDDIQSGNMVVIHDPTNMITADNYKDQDRLIEEPFQLYGDKIKIIHAKDFNIVDGEKQDTVTGAGILNYELLCRLTAQAGPGISILLEESNEDVAADCIAHIDNCWPA